MRQFTGNDNYGKPKSDYVALVAKMDDDALFKETKSKVWLSAYAANNPRSDYHWHVDAIRNEWEARGKAEKYGEAFTETKRETCG
jgi:hypothetical protein